MKFKKGDIVEVIERDYNFGNVYEVGSRWEVESEPENNEGKSYDIVHVRDDTSPTKMAILYKSNVKKVEGEKEMKFKIGDKVRCNDLHFEMDNHVYSFDNKYNVMEVVEIDDNLIECSFNGGLWNYRTEELDLVTDQPEELMIPVSLIYQVLESEPTNREIKAFLKGYKEGVNKNKTTD